MLPVEPHGHQSHLLRCERDHRTGTPKLFVGCCLLLGERKSFFQSPSSYPLVGTWKGDWHLYLAPVGPPLFHTCGSGTGGTLKTTTFMVCLIDLENRPLKGRLASKIQAFSFTIDVTKRRNWKTLNFPTSIPTNAVGLYPCYKYISALLKGPTLEIKYV